MKNVSLKTGKRLKDKVTVFNPGSRKQIAERLQRNIGGKFDKKTEKGNIIVDEKVLTVSTDPKPRLLHVT